MKLRHLGLFEGIGGFALAARWAGWETVAAVEIDHYCQNELKRNFPDAVVFGDIRKFTYSAHKSALRKKGEKNRRVDIITGGFPCQPFSVAGKRGGTADDRWLWPEMLRVVAECGPRWVVVENVDDFYTMDGGKVAEMVCADLDSLGYRVQPYCIEAACAGAVHRRARAFIVAHADRVRELQPQGRERDERGRDRDGAAQNVRPLRWQPETVGDLLRAGYGLSCGLDIGEPKEPNQSNGQRR